MRVLITNNTLAARAGTELYVRDVAFALLRRGHRPVAYSTLLGEVAEELRAATVPVVDDLSLLTQPPDVIHGHHHFETMAALVRFPAVPAVSFCHGWGPLEETPILFPRIRRYVAVDETTHDRLVAEAGVPATLVTRILNFVDLARFQPRSPLPVRPRRALAFSNEATESTTLPILREACARTGLDLDVAGWKAGVPELSPEQRLGAYDVVFAKARAALEAMAVGAAVVVCDGEGALAGLVTPERWSAWRPLNFGLRCLTRRLTVAALVEEIAGWRRENVEEVSRRTRAEAGMEDAVDRLVALYGEAERAERDDPSDPSAERAALVRYLVFLRGVVSQAEGSLARTGRRGAWLETEPAPVSAHEVEKLRAELARIEGTRTWRLRERLLKAPGVRAAWRLAVRSDRRR